MSTLLPENLDATDSHSDTGAATPFFQAIDAIFRRAGDFGAVTCKETVNLVTSEARLARLCLSSISTITR